MARRGENCARQADLDARVKRRTKQEKSKFYKHAEVQFAERPDDAPEVNVALQNQPRDGFDAAAAAFDSGCRLIQSFLLSLMRLPSRASTAAPPTGLYMQLRSESEHGQK
eukprot:2220421-Pyramimonas_sp.AAC.1